MVRTRASTGNLLDMHPSKRASSRIDVAVGGNIQEVRVAAGQSASQCAEMIGVPLDQYLLKEAGRLRFDATELVTLAQFLSVTIASLFRDDAN